MGEGKENQIKVNWRRWINKDNETLFDLIFGCIVYSIVFEVIGLLVVENKGSYSMGLLLGTAVAVGLSVSMYKGPEPLSCDDRTEGGKKYGTWLTFQISGYIVGCMDRNALRIF